MSNTNTGASARGAAGRDERLWTPADVRAFLCDQFTLKTLANWRAAGIGPPFVKISSRPLYRPAAVQAWVARRERNTSADGEAR